jgi:hypothetical protein
MSGNYFYSSPTHTLYVLVDEGHTIISGNDS